MNSFGVIARLQDEIAAFRINIPHGNMQVTTASGWSIGEQISHVEILAPYGVSQVRGLNSADPNLTSARPEFMRMLSSERIPRGPLQPLAPMRNPFSDQAHLVEDLHRAEQCILGLEPDVSKFNAYPGLVRHHNPSF
jgi:hypothetical protein